MHRLGKSEDVKVPEVRILSLPPRIGIIKVTENEII